MSAAIQCGCLPSVDLLSVPLSVLSGANYSMGIGWVLLLFIRLSDCKPLGIKDLTVLAQSLYLLCSLEYTRHLRNVNERTNRDGA